MLRLNIMRHTAWLALACLLVCSGCRTVTFSPSGERVPVLVGPIERIGDSASRRAQRKDVAVFDGFVKRRVVSASGTNTEIRGGSAYRVTRSAVEERSQGNLHSRISAAVSTTRGRRDVVVYLDDLRPYEYVHVGLGWTVGGVGVEAKGAVTRPAGEVR